MEPPPLRSGDLRPIPASPVFGFGAILVLAGRAAHLEAVGRPIEDILTSLLALHTDSTPPQIDPVAIWRRNITTSRARPLLSCRFLANWVAVNLI